MEEKKFGLILNPGKLKSAQEIRNLFANAPESICSSGQNAVPKIEVQKSMNLVVKALEEDQDIFDYDKFKDSNESEKAVIAARKRREPKYMEQMKRRALQRKQEMDIYFERNLKKEREKEDDQFGEKGVFLTSAYKKKLIEDQKWLESQRQQDEKDEKENAKTRKGLGEFYKSTISGSNVSVGVLESTVSGEDVSRVTKEEIAQVDLEAERRRREERNVFLPLSGPAPSAPSSSSSSRSDSRSSERGREERHHRHRRRHLHGHHRSHSASSVSGSKGRRRSRSRSRGHRH